MAQRPISVRPPPDEVRPKNKLLARLPDSDFARIREHLRTVPITVKQTLHPRDERIRDVYFLNGGVASMTMSMKDGAMVEIATIGDEGAVGITAFVGGEVMVGETMIQVPDTSAEIMPIEQFRREMARDGPFANGIQRYAQALLRLMMQSTACIALHPVQERCCRWLLMTRDRVGRDEFHLSHEFLAMMLGSTRPTVTLVAGVLQKAGIIKYTHGHITILDPAALEAASCECYLSVKEHFDRLDL
jgi:CRP-like cAMP-binding protein